MSNPPRHGPTPLHAGNLEYLRKQAKQLLRALRVHEPAALSRLVAVFGDRGKSARPTLADAQLVIAREAGFNSWAQLSQELRWRQSAREQHRLGMAAPCSRGEPMSTTESLQLGPIDQIGLSCTDLDEAERFYRDVLGLRSGGDVPGVMKFFEAGGVNLVLFKSESVPPNSILYFRVPPEAGAIERKVAQLKSRGVKVESDPHVIARNWNGRDVWLAFFRDPFGNLLALKSDVPAAHA